MNYFKFILLAVFISATIPYDGRNEYSIFSHTPIVKNREIKNIRHILNSLNSDYIFIQDSHIFGSSFSNFSISAHPASEHQFVKVGHREITEVNGENIYYSFDVVDDEIFGQRVKINLGDKIKIETYVPERMHAKSEDGARIDVGSILTWNEDENNSVGVLIGISTSSLQTKDEFHNLKDISWIDLTEDDGYYEIPDDLLKDIPSGAMIDVTLIRGTFELIESKDGKAKCNVIIYSSCRAIHYRA